MNTCLQTDIGKVVIIVNRKSATNRFRLIQIVRERNYSTQVCFDELHCNHILAKRNLVFNSLESPDFKTFLSDCGHCQGFSPMANNSL